MCVFVCAHEGVCVCECVRSVNAMFGGGGGGGPEPRVSVMTRPEKKDFTHGQPKLAAGAGIEPSAGLQGGRRLLPEPQTT